MRAAPLLLAGVALLILGFAITATINQPAGSLPTFIGGLITGVGLFRLQHNRRP